MRVIYGLGNPGRPYRGTRHNAGSRLVRWIASQHRLRFDQTLDGAIWTSGTIFDASSESGVLSLPATYINASGQGYRALREQFDVSHERMMVLYDDMDLEIGQIRLRASGGSGGHGGMNSVLDAAGTKEVPRLRIGIGRPPEGVSPRNYVLDNFTTDEEKVMSGIFERGNRAISCWARKGMAEAMNRFNNGGNGCEENSS